MEIKVLRIYMPFAAKAKEDLSFWQKIFNPSLASYLLKRSKEFGIEQAIFQRVMGGYLKGKKIAFEQAEVNSPDLPQCIELIDGEEKLRSFVEKFKNQLTDCRVVLFQSAQLI